MTRHGLRTLAARNTAMIETAAYVPAAVMSELLGIHINTAEQWTELARSNWADYLAAAST
ncbi:hypothetical protein F3087_19220 [Nocardia colli]|uniref:Uncharacterized protein n=1 Tax=Nocardia colli TaxID=2545717 RepID=A0A5N0EI58_9NOCA|nr:hypothetical protein [Nocardia colli]KAA8887051.1 hypothetical protein F3087_19220 [Nocardia colli]